MTHSQSFEAAKAAADRLRSRITGDIPPTAIILGSGLGPWADSLDKRQVVKFSEISGFPELAELEGHSRQFVVGTANGTSVLVQQGRIHFYEGHPMADVTLSTRVMGLLGIKRLIITNAAGGINLSYQRGDLMVIRDHYNAMGTNPLAGVHDDRFGACFPDMSNVYSLSRHIVNAAQGVRLSRSVHEGVYVAVQGPSYETPTEVRDFRSRGFDAVGMSTVPEAIVANQMSIQVGGISLITNAAAGTVQGHTLGHDEVIEAGQLAFDDFSTLLTRVLTGDPSY